MGLLRNWALLVAKLRYLLRHGPSVNYSPPVGGARAPPPEAKSASGAMPRYTCNQVGGTVCGLLCDVTDRWPEDPRVTEIEACPSML
jgi:hypothetical protein